MQVGEVLRNSFVVLPVSRISNGRVFLRSGNELQQDRIELIPCCDAHLELLGLSGARGIPRVEEWPENSPGANETQAKGHAMATDRPREPTGRTGLRRRMCQARGPTVT